MTKVPVLKAPEVIRALRRAGFEVIRQKGSHMRLRHSDGRVVTVPFHAGKDIAPGLLRKILRDIEMSVEEFTEHLKK